jgi:hypothetical protein
MEILLSVLYAIAKIILLAAVAGIIMSAIFLAALIARRK